MSVGEACEKVAAKVGMSYCPDKSGLDGEVIRLAQDVGFSRDAMAANPVQAAAGTAVQATMGAGGTGIMMAIESTLMAIFSKVKGD